MAVSLELINDIEASNPWLKGATYDISLPSHYVHRLQEELLLDPEWDDFWTILIGPRRAGKTTLGNYLCRELLRRGRYQQVLYLNCDYRSIHSEFHSPTLIMDLLKYFNLEGAIVFIDEVQRLETPGLILKALIDLNLPVKWIATGSSQLEIKSKVIEHLTGRAIESVVLPLSVFELPFDHHLEQRLIYGSYPKVVQADNKQIILEQLYKRYIEKDIIEILKIDKPHAIEKLIALVAHSSGQLVNYQRFATDCQVSVPTIQAHLQKLEQTYVLAKIMPFVGNKRTELTTNPEYFFIDNGFRNQALRNFSGLSLRNDVGMLVESMVFQELLKFKLQRFYDFDIHFWRTKSKAEVDFVAYKNAKCFMPIESKFRTMKKPEITRGFRSFLQAYQPKVSVVVTKDFLDEEVFEGTLVHFIPLPMLEKIFVPLVQALDLPSR